MQLYEDHKELEYINKFLLDAIHRSENENYKDISVSYPELILLYEMSTRMINRTERFNNLAKNLINRDMSLIHNMKVLDDSLMALDKTMKESSRLLESIKLNKEQSSLIATHFVKITEKEDKE